MKKEFPFKIRSIQVDEGAEFMGEFEASCCQSKIELFVLPPRSPKYNGTVERHNSTAKYEFYALYDGPIDLSHLRYALSVFTNNYNNFRPHQALQYQTPWQYYQLMRA